VLNIALQIRAAAWYPQGRGMGKSCKYLLQEFDLGREQLTTCNCWQQVGGWLFSGCSKHFAICFEVFFISLTEG